MDAKQLLQLLLLLQTRWCDWRRLHHHGQALRLHWLLQEREQVLVQELELVLALQVVLAAG